MLTQVGYLSQHAAEALPLDVSATAYLADNYQVVDFEALLRLYEGSMKAF
jgi:hypothetical protein